MQSSNTISPLRNNFKNWTTHNQQLTIADYLNAEQQFIKLLGIKELDCAIEAEPELAVVFEAALANALTVYQCASNKNALASSSGTDAQDARAPITQTFHEESDDQTAAHLFLQRTLYRINRLKFFWYDDLSHYDNERSDYLRKVRDHIETAWQQWELAEFDAAALRKLNVADALTERAAHDLDPAPSGDGLYFRDEAGAEGYRRFMEIFSLDALVEASQLSRTLGGASNEIHAMLTRVLVEEYGGGRLSRKHSSFFAAMLEELRMNTKPEAYFERVPWQVLAAINHSFLLSERKRYFLRYVGGLLYTEISVPAAFRNYQATAARLGLNSPSRMSYWDLHIKEDERHGQWMLNDVALPLIARYPNDAWELVLGYDQQRFISDRAGAATAQAAREADRADEKCLKAGA